MDTLGRFLAISTKGDNFCDFLALGAIAFLEADKKQFWQLSPLKVDQLYLCPPP